MLLNKDWDFETAVSEISHVYRPGGKTTGPLRNRQVESWGQIVGRTRALAEFDSTIERYGSLSAFGREYSVTLPILRNFRAFFASLPDDRVTNTTTEKKVFISYSWDNDDHKNWVRELAAQLRNDGVDVTLDQWHLVPGDQLPEFMERAIRESDYVLIICTHKYKEKSNNRQGGVGYEGDIITAEFMITRVQRKFIPILRQQTWADSAPNWMLGKIYIDFSSSPYPRKSYEELLSTLLGTREKAPIVGIAKLEKAIGNLHKVTVPEQEKDSFSTLKIKFTPYFGKIIEYFWNDGHPREMTVANILNNLGTGAYGNYNKLRLKPWLLIESANKPSDKKTYRLTENGKLFAQGFLKIPEEISKSTDSADWEASPSCREISIGDLNTQ